MLTLLCALCATGMRAGTVRITMNTTSPTMTLTDLSGDTLVNVGEPATRVYTFEAAPGDYLLTAFASNGTTQSGTLRLSVGAEAEQAFSVQTLTFYATNKGWTEGTDYTIAVDVLSNEGHARVNTMGQSSTAGRRTVLALTGDGYKATFMPNEAHTAEGYLPFYKTGTLTSSINVSGAIPMGGDFTVSIPAEASLFVGRKINHFVAFSPVEPTGIETQGGNRIYTYKLGDGQQYNYRTSMEGGLTHAGTFYMSTDEAKCPKLAFTPDDYKARSPHFIDTDVHSNLGYNVADILFNLNAQKHLRMDVGADFDLLAMRLWELTTTSTENYFIEPDFHYTLQSLTPGREATDIITLSQDATNVDPWTTLHAVGRGTVMVTVTYDAMAVKQHNNQGVASDFLGGEYWSALWPENTGVFVVSVGEDAPALTPGMTLNEGRNEAESKQSADLVDADFDVFYFDQSADGYTYTFHPIGVTDVKVAYPTIDKQVVTYQGFGTEGVTQVNDTTWSVLLRHGRQVVALYDAQGRASYQVLTAKAVSTTVSNLSRPGAQLLLPGEEVGISFSTLYHPANKLAGIHNFSAAIDYAQLPEGATAKATANQYLFASTAAAQTLTVTLPTDLSRDTIYSLDGGTIKVTAYGDPLGNHRATSRQTGRMANFTALQRTAYLGTLPQLQLAVSLPTQFTLMPQCDVEGITLTLAYGDKVLTPEADGSYRGTFGTYSYTADKDGYRRTHGTFTVDEDATGIQEFTIAMTPLAAGDWDGRTADEPSLTDEVYQISSGAELAWFADKVNAGQYTLKGALTADIHLGHFDWTPIGGSTAAKAFKGTFDGQGHRIDGLYIDRPTATYQGLFGYLNGATVQGLTVGGAVSAKQYVGGVAAYMGANASIDRCANEADVTGSSTYVGGVTGHVSVATAKLTNSYNLGHVTGTTYCGGVAGGNNATAVISGIYNLGEVSGTTVAALVGGTTAKTNMTQAFATAEYAITTGQTTVSEWQILNGEVAYLLGEAYGQQRGRDRHPVLGGMAVTYDATTGNYSNAQTPVELDLTDVITFEDIDLPADGYDNGADGSGFIASGGYYFMNYYDDQYRSWSGFAASSTVGNEYSGSYSDATQYNSFLGGGMQSKTFLMGYYFEFDAWLYDHYPLIIGDEPFAPQSVWVSNAAVTMKSMLLGDAYAHRFTQADTLKLIITGLDDEDEETGRVEVLMARGTDLLCDWTEVDLTPLGTVTSLQFSMSSTDLSYGMINTPTYFVLDNFKANPSSATAIEALRMKDGQSGNAADADAAGASATYDLMGRRVSALRHGLHIAGDKVVMKR